MSKHRNIRNAKRIVKSGILSNEATILRKTFAFKQASAVIGPEAAMRELLRVVREYDSDMVTRKWFNAKLSGCFIWSGSPQGHKFWCDINYSPKCPR